MPKRRQVIKRANQYLQANAIGTIIVIFDEERLVAAAGERIYQLPRKPAALAATNCCGRSRRTDLPISWAQRDTFGRQKM